MATNSALEALQAASGVAPSEVSLVIRSILLALVFFWAGACFYSKLNRLRHHDVDLFDAQGQFLRILFIVAIAVALVFIS